jgi:hypothetical protein
MPAGHVAGEDPIEPSSQALITPWMMGRVDGSLSRNLGFSLEISTVYQAARKGIL